MLLELADERGAGLVARPQDDERLDDLAAIGIRLAHDGALGDRRVLEESALDLEGPDAIRGREDDVVGATGEPQVAVLVA
jgi:hypothetical protein